MSTLFVKVPGSTSNLGPGFDCLGLALSTFLEVEVDRAAASGEAHSVARSGPAAAELDRLDALEPGASRRDLLVEAFSRGAERWGARGPHAFRARCGIPVGRGFGSSGAAVAAGLLLARELADREVELEELYALGLGLEGHPDNITASLFGGATLGHPQADERPAWIRVPVAAGLGFALAWPPEPLSTRAARAVLPDTVPFRDAVENPRRLALLLEGLRTGDPRLLAIGSEDRLHERYRLPFLPGAERALADARAAGAFLANLSGAGSGLVAIGPKDRMERIVAALRHALLAATGGGEARVVEPVFGTPRVERR